jgi:hypothetical protein
MRTDAPISPLRASSSRLSCPCICLPDQAFRTNLSSRIGTLSILLPARLASRARLFEIGFCPPGLSIQVWVHSRFTKEFSRPCTPHCCSASAAWAPACGSHGSSHGLGEHRQTSIRTRPAACTIGFAWTMEASSACGVTTRPGLRLRHPSAEFAARARAPLQTLVAPSSFGYSFPQPSEPPLGRRPRLLLTRAPNRTNRGLISTA